MKKQEEPPKDRLIMQAKVEIENGLNSENSARLAIFCKNYKDAFDDTRTVHIANLSKARGRYLEAVFVTNLLSLSAGKGDELEVRVDGADDSAKAFCYDIRRALMREGYLREKTDALKHSAPNPQDLRPLYKRDYKEPARR